MAVPPDIVCSMLLGTVGAKDVHLFCSTVEALQVIVVTLIFRHDMDDYIPKVQHLPAATANPKHKSHMVIQRW